MKISKEEIEQARRNVNMWAVTRGTKESVIKWLNDAISEKIERDGTKSVV